MGRRRGDLLIRIGFLFRRLEEPKVCVFSHVEFEFESFPEKMKKLQG